MDEAGYVTTLMPVTDLLDEDRAPSTAAVRLQ